MKRQAILSMMVVLGLGLLLGFLVVAAPPSPVSLAAPAGITRHVIPTGGETSGETAAEAARSAPRGDSWNDATAMEAEGLSPAIGASRIAGELVCFAVNVGNTPHSGAQTCIAGSTSDAARAAAQTRCR